MSEPPEDFDAPQPKRTPAKRKAKVKAPAKAKAPAKPKAAPKARATAKPKAATDSTRPAKPRAPRKPRAVKPEPDDVTTTPAPKTPARPRKPRATAKRKATPAPPQDWQLTPENSRALCLGGMLMAIAFLLGMYWAFAIDYPYYDQWDFVPFLEKSYAGQLTWHDYWTQHNEHRLFFPRLLMVVLARLSDWDMHWELTANVVLATLTWLVLCGHAAIDGQRVHRASNEAVYLLFTIMIFSLSQWQNWFLGWQLQEFMNVLAVVLALITLSWRTFPGVGVATAACFGIVATYSFANGMLIWPIGLVLLFLQRGDRGKFAREEILAWGVVGLVVVVSYLRDYQTPAYHPPLASALAQPLQCALYVLAYLGQPVWNLDPIISIVMGLVGLLLWSVTLVQLLISRVSVGILAPWAGMALYAIGTACITALGRVDNGLDQAMSSRYVTMANLLWIPAAIQLYWVAQISDEPAVRRALPWKIGVLGALLLLASVTGACRWTERYNAYTALRGDVVAGYDLERLKTIYPPDPQVVIERRIVLQRLGLSIFATDRAPEIATAPQ